MKQIAVMLLLSLALACKNEPVVDTSTMDTRAAIGVWYVGAPELIVREKPDDAAAMIAKYQNGEAITVLVQQGEWAEIRTGERSGWIKMADLVTAEQRKEAEANPQPKFRKPPLPVTAPGARGEMYLEADVNTDGDVIAVRVITDSTNNPMLAQKNIAVLKAAKFEPIVQNGERRTFKYYHRVSY